MVTESRACPSCGDSVPPGRLSCPHCGAVLAAVAHRVAVGVTMESRAPAKRPAGQSARAAAARKAAVTDDGWDVDPDNAVQPDPIELDARTGRARPRRELPSGWPPAVAAEMPPPPAPDLHEQPFLARRAVGPTRACCRRAQPVGRRRRSRAAVGPAELLRRPARRARATAAPEPAPAAEWPPAPSAAGPRRRLRPAGRRARATACARSRRNRSPPPAMPDPIEPPPVPIRPRAWDPVAAAAGDGAVAAVPATPGRVGRIAMPRIDRERVEETADVIMFVGSFGLVLSFLAPWADVVIGSRGRGYMDTWGLAGPGHIALFLLALGVLALAALQNPIGRWLRTGVAGVALGAFVLGLAWPYVVGPLGAGPGALLAWVSGLVLFVAGIVSLLVLRHAALPPDV